MENYNTKDTDDLDIDLNKSCRVIKMIAYMKDSLKMTSNMRENIIVTTQQKDVLNLNTKI